MSPYYLPGNHGYRVHHILGASLSFSPNATARYKSHFGPLNHRITISNHSVLFIDAPGLVEEDRERMRHGYPYGGIGEGGKGGWSAMPGGTVDFVRQFAASEFFLFFSFSLDQFVLRVCLGRMSWKLTMSGRKS